MDLNQSRRGRLTELGAVTVETAMALPVLAIFALTMAWLVSIGVTEVRTVDAAREAARAAARAEDPGQARGLAREVAPEGSSISISRGAGTVVVRVSSPVREPAGLLRGVGSFRVHAEAVAALEPTS